MRIWPEIDRIVNTFSLYFSLFLVLIIALLLQTVPGTTKKASTVHAKSGAATFTLATVNANATESVTHGANDSVTRMGGGIGTTGGRGSGGKHGGGKHGGGKQGGGGDGDGGKKEDVDDGGGDEDLSDGGDDDKLQVDKHGSDDGDEKEAPILLVHKQPVAREDTGEDGYLPVRDDWLGMLDRINDHPNAEQAAYERATEMAYLIRERQDDERCKTSVALCDSYTSMWPQIDGLCDLFFVKCLVEVAGMVCRNYTEKDIFRYATDLCDNVSDFCTQNREAVIAFCWGHLYQRYGATTMNPLPKKTGFNKFMDYLIAGLSSYSPSEA